MTNPIFAYPRHQYDSYRDFKRIVELSGYESCFVDEIDAYNPDKCYIITPHNGEWSDGWPDATARIIHWDLEWRHATDYPTTPGVTETWCSDPWYAMHIGARFVLLGSHPDLNPNPADRDGHFDYDVAFLAYMGPWRRQLVASAFNLRRIALAPNGWGEERHRILSKTRLMVHIHQWDEFACIAPQRWAIAAAYKLPLLSEAVHCEIKEIADGVVYAGHAHLSEVALSWLDNGAAWYLGQKLHQALCVDYTFRRNVEAAL